MALTETPQANLGWKAKEFRLKGVDEKIYELKDIANGHPFVILFICNHCPYVKRIIKNISAAAKYLEGKVNFIAIMSNDTQEYPEDSFKNMKEFAKENNFIFPYVIDETQEVARQYGAVCTPDFFGFNADLQLSYRGRFDSPENTEIEKAELVIAMLKIYETGECDKMQSPSIGCSIKWY